MDKPTTWAICGALFREKCLPDLLEYAGIDAPIGEPVTLGYDPSRDQWHVYNRAAAMILLVPILDADLPPGCAIHAAPGGQWIVTDETTGEYAGSAPTAFAAVRQAWAYHDERDERRSRRARGYPGQLPADVGEGA